MSEKKIEPTDAMVDEAANALSIDGNGTSLHHRSDGAKRAYLKIARIALRAALNHPDARGLLPFEVVDALRAAREQGWDQAVEWIEEDQDGPSGRTTNARNANPHRPAPTLPNAGGAIIVPAEGHEYVEAAFIGETYYAREAMLADDLWRAAWRTADGVRVRYSVLPEDITPGTWKADDR